MQFIGVIFPSKDFNFSSTALTCGLSSSTVTYAVSFVAPVNADATKFSGKTAETDTAYCQLVDTTNHKLPVNENLTLSLTFPEDISVNFIQNIGIFTSTTNNPDKIIIDYSPSLGNLGLYTDYTQENLNKIATIGTASENGSSKPLFTITSPSTPVSTTTLYPNYTIKLDINVEIKYYWIINPQDYIFYFKYNTVNFQEPNTITAYKYSDAENEGTLKGSITKIAQPDGFLIDGFEKSDLYPNRKFNISIEGFKTTEDNLGTSTLLELLVLYRNTYSVISYSKMNMDSVNKINLATAVNHPENFPVYDGMGWPFLFSITTPVDIPNGGYVVIRQRGYDVSSASVVLVASSCDFSRTSIAQDFGSRGNCLPLRNNFDYDTATTVSGESSLQEGQGIFFKFPSFLASAGAYRVQVWGFIDVCYDSNNTTTSFYKNLSFTIRIFKKVKNNDTVLNEKIFFGNADNHVIAEKLDNQLASKCFPLQRIVQTTTANYIDVTLVNNGDIGTIANAVGNNAKSVGIEINNITIVKAPTVLSDLSANVRPAGSETLFKYDATTVTFSTTYTPKYMTSGSELNGSPLFFYAVHEALATGAATGNELAKYLPSECDAFADNAAAYNTDITNGRLTWYFTNQWFEENLSIANGCQLGWIITSQNGLDSQSQEAISLYFSDQTVVDGANDTDIVKTIINSYSDLKFTKNNFEHKQSTNMQKTTSNLTLSSSDPISTFKIVSTKVDLSTSTWGPTTWKQTPGRLSMISASCVQVGNTTNISTDKGGHLNTIAVFTDCLKWKSIPSTFTSLFAYFEVQQVLELDNGDPHRIWRFIKLFPEYGVFQDPSSLENITDANATYEYGNTKWAVNHYEATTGSYAPFAVCVIELESRYVNVFKDTSSNTLIVWLFAASLLDNDLENDQTFEYPVAPLSSSSKAYGNNSGQTMGMAFRQMGDQISSTKFYPNISSSGSANTLLSLIEYKFYSTVLRRSLRNSGTVTGRWSQGIPTTHTMYQFYMGSIVYIPTTSEPSTTSNLYIPYLCPSYSNWSATTSYPTNGIYWVNPIMSAAWAQMSKYNSITKIDRYIRPKVKVVGTPSSLHEQFEYNSGWKQGAYLTFNSSTGSQGALYFTPTVVDPLQFPLYKSKQASGQKILDCNPRVDSAVTSRSYDFIPTKINFNSYTKTTNNQDKTLNIGYRDTSSTTPATTELSSINLFLNDKIGTLETTITVSGSFTSGSTATFSVATLSTNKVLLMGIPFNRYLAFGYTKWSNNSLRAEMDYTSQSTTATDNNLFSADASSSLTVTGIPRIDINTYDTTGAYINNWDYMALYTNRNTYYLNTKKYFLTNYIISDDGSTSTFRNFLLDYPNVDNTAWTSPVLATDNTDNPIKDDKGANLKVTFSTPTIAPIGSKIQVEISSSVLNTSTVCGMVEADKPLATVCSINSSIVECQLTKSTSAFNICCYNIYNNNQTIDAKQGTLNMPRNTSYLTTSLVAEAKYNDDLYVYPATTTSSSLASYDFSTRNVENLSSSDSAYYPQLKILNYLYSNSDLGVGMVTFQIDCPRQFTRGMIMQITVNLSEMKINNIKPRLYAVFGNSQLYGSSSELGDLFLDSIHSNWDASGISLKLKNFIYKCGISLSNSVSIFAYPIATKNYESLQVQSITMLSPDNSQLSNSNSHTVSSQPTFTVTSPNTTNVNDFFKITSITPNINSEYAEYKISLSFTTVSSSLEGKTANEIFLYFPEKYFYVEKMNIICLSKDQSLLSCETLQRNLLSIRFPNGISNISGDEDLMFSIVGIKNPYIPLQNGEYFLCAVNETNFKNGQRTTLVKGVYTISEGIIPNTITTFGNIVYKNEFTYQTFTIPTQTTTGTNTNSTSGSAVAEEEKLNPREEPNKVNANYESLHTFGFNFDLANDMLKIENGFTFTNDPVMYLTFPEEYKFHLYKEINKSLKPTAVIKAYKVNDVDLKTIEEIKVCSIKNVDMIGNQIIITFNESSFTIDQHFQYFRLWIYKLPPPTEKTDIATEKKTTTQAFNMLMVNSDRSLIYRTWTNLNTLSKLNNLDLVDEMLKTNKGLRYAYDEKKWIIDIVTRDSSLPNNHMELRTGRYVKYAFKRRSTNKHLPPVEVNIQLTDNKVKLIKDFYSFGTYLNSYVDFYIGIGCKEIPGFMYIQPIYISSNLNNPYVRVLPMPPTFIRIKNNKLGMINFNAESTIRVAGSLFVDFSTTTPPYDDLEIKFVKSTDSEIDPATILKNTFKARTIFRITNENATEIQSYQMGVSTSECYEFQHKKISFIISGAVSIIPNDGIQASNFAYKTSIDDSNLQANQIKFTFTTVYNQIYLYAILTCMKNEFPSDQSMKTGNVTTTDETQYISEILTIADDIGYTELLFSNLIRGTPYKLKVIIESVEGNLQKRTSSKVVITNTTLANGTVIDIVAQQKFGPVCANYRFKTKPGDQTTNPLLWYWQESLSQSGYYESGCLTAVDTYGTVIPGIPSIANETLCGSSNCKFISKTQHIANQTNTVDLESYTICAYPKAVCTTDPTNIRTYVDDITTKVNNNNTFKTELDVFVVPEFSITIVDDNNVPSKPTITNIKTTGNKVSFDAVSTSPVLCIIKALEDSSKDDFEDCDGNNCQSISVSSKVSPYTLTLNNASKSLTIFGKCRNDMPCSVKRSEIFTVGTYSPSDSSASSGSTNNTSTNTTSTSTNWISMSNMIVLLILSLIFS